MKNEEKCKEKEVRDKDLPYNQQIISKAQQKGDTSGVNWEKRDWACQTGHTQIVTECVKITFLLVETVRVYETK